MASLRLVFGASNLQGLLFVVITAVVAWRIGTRAGLASAVMGLIASHAVRVVANPALLVNPGALLTRQYLVGMASYVLLSVLAATVAGVRLPPLQWLGLVATCLLGVLPFSALGLWLGTLVGGRGAPALINLVYLPMAFLSGLWVPLTMLPKLLQTLAPAWPAYHLAQIAQKVVGVDAGRPLLLHVAVLVAITVVFFLLARRRLAH